MDADLLAEIKARDDVTVYFNPFAFTIEQNNEFLRLGYEPMPMRIPGADRDGR